MVLVGAAARWLPGGWIELSPQFAFLASDWFLIVAGVMLAIELAADKIPLVDHALDTVQTVVKPAVGTIVAAAMFVQLSPFHATLLGLAVGGTVATGVHLAKAKVRALSTLTTGTVLNPILSFIEDVVSTVIAVVAVLAPVLALLFIAAIFGYAFDRLHKRYIAGPPNTPRSPNLPTA